MRNRWKLSGLRVRLTQKCVRLNYPDTYSYDLDGNQIQKVQTNSAGTETTTNTYNGDDQLTQSVDSSTGTTTYGYDANGSQTSSTNGGNVTTYTYDVRNRLVSVTTGGVTTTYGYDDAGNRVSETTNGTTTYYLIDSNNPTGYAKPVEQWTSTTGNRSTATLSMSYCLGDRVLAQVNGSGVVSYLLIDGQDNTRALTNSSGVVTATFNYNAFGSVLGANYTLSSPSPTIFLFQQMMFDTASGLNFTESRQTPMGSAYWIERDPDGYGDNTNPITLNATLFDNANPLVFTDPTGHDGLADILVTMGIGESLDSSDDEEDIAGGQAARRVLQSKQFDVYVALEKGAVRTSGLAILPHAAIYVNQKAVPEIGTSFDVINSGLLAQPRGLEEEEGRAFFLKRICQFSYLQYAEWYSSAYLTADLVQQPSGSTFDGAALADFEALGLTLNTFRFGSGYVNCFKFTVIAGIEAYGISKLNI